MGWRLPVGVLLSASAAAMAWMVTAPRPIDAAIAREVSVPGDPVAGRSSPPTTGRTEAVEQAGKG